jgi:hypothetical protein
MLEIEIHVLRSLVRPSLHCLHKIAAVAKLFVNMVAVPTTEAISQRPYTLSAYLVKDHS